MQLRNAMFVWDQPLHDRERVAFKTFSRKPLFETQIQYYVDTLLYKIVIEFRGQLVVVRLNQCTLRIDLFVIWVW